MGWGLWGSSGSPSSQEVKSLDPSLREFLEKETPKHKEAQPKQPEQSYTAQLEAKSTPEPSASASHPTAPAVPAESQYPDGRYAQLWKNYKPLYAIEAAQKTDQDRLRDLVEEQDARKAQLGMMALENCALEQLAEQDCLRSGSASRLMLCRTEAKAFHRCYEMQAKFMKALGYMAVMDNPAEAERIQMHADKLYQTMIEQEKLVEEAKANDQPLPHFEPILSTKNVGGALAVLRRSSQEAATDEAVEFSRIPEPMRKKFAKEVKGKSPQEIAIEEAAYLAELENQRRVAAKGSEYLQEEKEKRQKRFEQGTATVGDRMKRWWGWDDDRKQKD